MKVSTISTNPSAYIDYIHDRLKLEFGPNIPDLYSRPVLLGMISAFHGFKSFEAFLRAIKSFDNFEAYRLEKVKVLRNILIDTGYINVYKYLTGFYKDDVDTLAQDYGVSISISDTIAEKISKFICGIHSCEGLTFIDILGVKYSQAVKLPMYVHKEDKNFFKTIDYYSASFIIKSMKLKRTEHVSYVVENEHCNVDIHNVFTDVFGFFDLNSYYNFMKVFKKIIYKDASRITGNYDSNSIAYKSNKNKKPVGGLSDFDWRGLCELMDIAVIQSHLTLARFLFRFYKHPKKSNKNKPIEGFTEYESFVSNKKKLKAEKVAS